MTEPATPFWQGYVRPASTTGELIVALMVAMEKNPRLRFGQLLVNVLGEDTEFLFGIWDEYVIDALNRFGQEAEQ